MNNPYNELSDDAFLVYLAQNDYMIDGSFLPEGKRLVEMAARLKKPNEALDRIAELDREIGIDDIGDRR